MHGRARFSKQGTSCIRIHMRPCAAPIAAQHEAPASRRAAVQTAENARVTGFLLATPSFLPSKANTRHAPDAATAARMNTYANPASKRNRATKLHHADKLCVLLGERSPGAWGFLALPSFPQIRGIHLRSCGKAPWIPRFRGNDGEERTWHPWRCLPKERSRSGEFRIH